MFTNIPLVAVIFRFINFFALIALGIFFFKRYVLTDILLKIAQKKAYLETLFAQQAMLEKEQLILNEYLKEDAQLCEKFKMKIDEWKSVIIQEHAIQDQEYLRLQETLKQRALNRALYKKETETKKAVIDSVVARLENSLTDYFKDPSYADEYLENILAFMNERK